MWPLQQLRRHSAPLPILVVVVAVSSFLPTAFPYAETGRWDEDLVVKSAISKPFAKSMFTNTSVYLNVKVDCDVQDEKLIVKWVLRRTSCAEEYISLLRSSETEQRSQAGTYIKNPGAAYVPQKIGLDGKQSFCHISYIEDETTVSCTGHTNVEFSEPILQPKEVELCSGHSHNAPAAAVSDNSNKEPTGEAPAGPPVASTPHRRRRRRAALPPKPAKNAIVHDHLITRSWQDGVYALFIQFRPVTQNTTFRVNMTVEMKSDYGYLSAGDYPKRPFYLVMCLLYVVYGVAWLIALASKWRDLLQIQFWIGGVIILGTLEKAVFYTEYQTINNTGVSTPGAVLFAEIVSCAKRTLARMLVIIVSLGFGIVKPRLGPLLHRILLLGAVYFILGSFEAGLRTQKHAGDQSQQLLLAQIPLAVIDAGICWWVFSSLVQTMRTLRLRRNTTKLGLFRHLTNVIIFSVIASVIFMIWSIRSHRIVECLTDWKELWVDDAFWHALFSILLAVIMVLWRPTANNQRYAFSALLDDADDADPEEEPMMTEAYEGMKLRSHVGDGGPAKDAVSNAQVSSKSPDDKFEEDLKWVEENIPTSVADAALPSLLDSDEEIMTTKFEMSKME